MKKSLLLICIPLLVFASLERENISLFLGTKTRDMGYYIGSDTTIQNYNEAVFLVRDAQYSEAKLLLQLILNSKNLKNPADVYELYGDLVYETRGSTGDIAVFYNRSLEYQNSERVKKKLKLLSTLAEPKKEQISENTTLDTLQDMTGEMIRETRRQELFSDTKQNIRNLSAGMIDPQDLITRTLDILSTSSSIPKDW